MTAISGSTITLNGNPARVVDADSLTTFSLANGTPATLASVIVGDQIDAWGYYAPTQTALSALYVRIRELPVVSDSPDPARRVPPVAPVCRGSAGDRVALGRRARAAWARSRLRPVAHAPRPRDERDPYRDHDDAPQVPRAVTAHAGPVQCVRSLGDPGLTPVMRAQHAEDASRPHGSSGSAHTIAVIGNLASSDAEAPGRLVAKCWVCWWR